MKTNILFGILIISLLASISLTAQRKAYTVTSGEFIFSSANMELKSDFTQAFPKASIEANPLRFTCFFHGGTYRHIDYNNTFGVYSGLALRNVGFISDEVLPKIMSAANADDYQDFKIIRRTYNLGVPFAIKLGNFKKDYYVFGGGELEWAFVSKTKWWKSHDRDGDKTKNVDWFPNETDAIIPSVFGGIKFPGGLQLKFTYYLNNIINEDNVNMNQPLEADNLYRYKDIHVMFISLSYQMKTSDFMPPKKNANTKTI